jgi:hypothetical protein
MAIEKEQDRLNASAERKKYDDGNQFRADQKKKAQEHF